MGMSINIVGIIPVDEKYKEMELIFNTCKKNKIAIPNEVVDFFNGEHPDPKGTIVELLNYESTYICTDWSSSSSTGYEIKVEDIPENIKIIRFYNSW
jgi:hypothetical protein